MALNTLSPTTLTGLLVGDTTHAAGKGPVDALPSPTLVGSLPVCAVLEVKSTDGGFLLPRMTQAQINALPPTGTAITPGLQVFNSDTKSVATYVSGGSGTGSNAVYASPPLVATGTLTAAQFTTIDGNPIQLINGAPSTAIVVEEFVINYIYNTAAFTGGGNVGLEYGKVTDLAGPAATATFAASTFTGTSNRISKVLGTNLANLSSDVKGNGVYISNDTAVFAGGGSSTVNYTITYRLIPVA